MATSTSDNPLNSAETVKDNEFPFYVKEDVSTKEDNTLEERPDALNQVKIPQGEGSRFDSDMVDGIHAYTTPTPNALVPLGKDGKFPSEVIPSSVSTTSAYYIQTQVSNGILDVTLSLGAFTPALPVGTTTIPLLEFFMTNGRIAQGSGPGAQFDYSVSPGTPFTAGQSLCLTAHKDVAVGSVVRLAAVQTSGGQVIMGAMIKASF